MEAAHLIPYACTYRHRPSANVNDCAASEPAAISTNVTTSVGRACQLHDGVAHAPLTPGCRGRSTSRPLPAVTPTTSGGRDAHLPAHIVVAVTGLVEPPWSRLPQSARGDTAENPETPAKLRHREMRKADLERLLNRPAVSLESLREALAVKPTAYARPTRAQNAAGRADPSGEGGRVCRRRPAHRCGPCWAPCPVSWRPRAVRVGTSSISGSKACDSFRNASDRQPKGPETHQPRFGSSLPVRLGTGLRRLCRG